MWFIPVVVSTPCTRRMEESASHLSACRNLYASSRGLPFGIVCGRIAWICSHGNVRSHIFPFLWLLIGIDTVNLLRVILLCHCTGCRECGSACTDSLPAERNYLTGESNCFHSCELLHARYHLHMQVLLQRLGSSWLKLVGPPPHITIYFRGRSKDFQGGESRLTKRHYPHLEQNICTTTKNDLRVFCCSNHG